MIATIFIIAISLFCSAFAATLILAAIEIALAKRRAKRNGTELWAKVSKANLKAIEKESREI